jgi:hypothetical protein
LIAIYKDKTGIYTQIFSIYNEKMVFLALSISRVISSLILCVEGLPLILWLTEDVFPMQWHTPFKYNGKLFLNICGTPGTETYFFFTLQYSWVDTYQNAVKLTVGNRKSRRKIKKEYLF